MVDRLNLLDEKLAKAIAGGQQANHTLLPAFFDSFPLETDFFFRSFQTEPTVHNWE